jgi:hypothetical protein
MEPLQILGLILGVVFILGLYRACARATAIALASVWVTP